ncbi:hypothetical protein MTP99_019047 [Tenebrio molitor]|jgi:hypothetical protein|nr:hypothetical protein MTP99_019047 [Tenebrio molitor]CAH1377651.1 unnamed protein product [Tenebrio molitor]
MFHKDITSGAHEQARKDYVRLAVLQKNLRKICSSINKEIMQTDVEWMNLVALSKNSDKTNKPSTSTQIKSSGVQQSLENPEQTLQTLNLNPTIQHGVQQTHMDEEFDSD